MLADQALTELIKRAPKKVLNIGDTTDGKHTQIMRKLAGIEVVTCNLTEPADIVCPYLNAHTTEYDAIWSSHCLEHQVNPGLFLSKIFQDLNEGGLLCITVPPAKEKLAGGHVTIWNETALLYQLIMAGFDCWNAEIWRYGYNISCILEKKTRPFVSWTMSKQDLDMVKRFMPVVLNLADPNNIILPDLKLAFMCIPKNANTSLKRALITALGITGVENPHDPTVFVYTNKQYIKNRIVNDGWLAVGIKRNPYDRIASCWRQKVLRPEGLHRGFKKYYNDGIVWKQSFNDFVTAVSGIPDWKADQHFRSQYWDLCIGMVPIPQILLPIETLQEEWPVAQGRIFDHCGLEMPSLLKSKNATDKSNQPYTKNIRQMVRKRYSIDFGVFGYEP